MYIFMYLPILVLGLYSFNAARYGAVWEGFSLTWYRHLLQDQRLFNALVDSLAIAISAVAISAVLGSLMAIGLAKCRFPGKTLYQGVAYLPLIVPDIAIAVATLVFLASVGLRLSLSTVIAAHVVFCLAYIAIVVASRLRTLDPHLEEAALDLGATPRQALLRVLIPQLTPAILAGCLLAFVLSLDDLLISSFTAGSGINPLPVEIYSRLNRRIQPDLNALSVLLILASGLIAALAEYLRYRAEKPSAPSSRER
jgi:spermidine/putrescine transport system permease protein